MELESVLYLAFVLSILAMTIMERLKKYILSHIFCDFFRMSVDDNDCGYVKYKKMKRNLLFKFQLH